MALLMGSLVLIHLNPKIDENSLEEVHCIFLINCIRGMHGYVVLSQLICFKLDTVENDLYGKFISTVEIFFYQGTVLYELYFLLHHPLDQGDKDFTRVAKEWIIIEMSLYFFQIFNTALFLMYIVIRGELGATDLKIKDEKMRCLYDAIEYYITDIEWVSF